MQKNKGITLVGLVVTIIVLLIVAGVSIAFLTGDNGLITRAKEAAENTNLESIKEEIKLKISEEITSNNGLKLTNDAYKSILEKHGQVEYEDDGITVKGVLIPSGKEILLADLGNINSSDESSVVSSGVWNGKVNEPKLAVGMTGIYWDDSNNEIIVTSDNKSNWYDYENKKWANAKTADGSYWVWIPRYEYKIPVPHSSTPQTIDVRFIQNTNTTADAEYIMHPGFTFGITELTGIWVAKFEASGTTSEIESKPNVVSLRNNTISDMFDMCRNMETNSRYGWGTSGSKVDTHMMKNVEWGVAAYLSSSQYGKTGEVWMNPNCSFITGQAGTAALVSPTTVTYPYNDTTYGVNASTTGNIYGIYDMSGGVFEYTAGYVNTTHAYLNIYGGSLVSADTKYKDVYEITYDDSRLNYQAAENKKGDAIYETSSNSYGNYSWYNGYTYMPHTSGPFFIRGGDYTTGVIFAMYYPFDSYTSSRVGFRPVIAVDTEL